MKKYFSFILIALIAFLLNIFILFAINDMQFYKKELLFIEFMVLLSVIIAIKLFFNSRFSGIMALIFFMIMTVNALILFTFFKSILPTTLLLISLYGVVYYMRIKTKPKKKALRTTRRSEEIGKLITPEEKPKIIIEKKKFVAAKYGKYFYKEDSPEAKRLRSKNKVYFETKAEAKKKGYKEYK